MNDDRPWCPTCPPGAPQRYDNAFGHCWRCHYADVPHFEGVYRLATAGRTPDEDRDIVRYPWPETRDHQMRHLGRERIAQLEAGETVVYGMWRYRLVNVAVEAPSLFSEASS